MRWRLRIPLSLLPWLSVIFLAVLLLGPTSLLIWLLLFTNTFSVQSITVLDAREHTTQSVKAIAYQRLASIPFRQSIFLLASDTLATSILGQLPQVRTVQVRRQLPGTLRIVVQEKEPALLLFSQGDYFLVDQQGIPYEEAKLETLPGIVLPTVKNNDPAGVVVIGTRAVSEDFVGFIQEVQETLPDKLATQVAEIRIPSLATREVHFYLGNNWQLRFDVTRTASSQLKVLQRVVHESIPPTEISRLEYIDLRIPDRVYYMIKGADSESL